MHFPWSTDLEPRVVDRVPRFKLRGSRLVDAGPGLLWLVAEDGSNWAEGMGRVLAGLAARTADRDGLVKSTESDFVWACHQLQILPPQPTARKIRKPLSD